MRLAEPLRGQRQTKKASWRRKSRKARLTLFIRPGLALFCSLGPRCTRSNISECEDPVPPSCFSSSVANEGRNDYHPMFFTHDRAFEELFGICIQLLNKTWKEMRATAEDFNKVSVPEL